MGKTRKDDWNIINHLVLRGPPLNRIDYLESQSEIIEDISKKIGFN